MTRNYNAEKASLSTELIEGIPSEEVMNEILGPRDEYNDELIALYERRDKIVGVQGGQKITMPLSEKIIMQFGEKFPLETERAIGIFVNAVQDISNVLRSYHAATGCFNMDLSIALLESMAQAIHSLEPAPRVQVELNDIYRQIQEIRCIRVRRMKERKAERDEHESSRAN